MPLTAHQFQLNGEAVELHELGVEPLRLVHDFGRGATLTLRQTRDHHAAALQPNDHVRYLADGVTRFIGLVRGRGRSTIDDSIVYTVQDAAARADSVSVSVRYVRLLNTETFEIHPSGTVGGVIETALSQADQQYDADSLAVLDGRARVRSPFRGTLAAFLREAMRAAPKHRLIVTPNASGQEIWRAVQVYESGQVQSLRWGGAAVEQDELVGRVVNLDIGESIEGCYTAVLIVQPGIRTTTSEYDKESIVPPGWNTDMEEQWSVDAAGYENAADASVPEDVDQQLGMVYRAWRLPKDELGDFDPEQPWKLMIQQPPNAKLGIIAIRWYAIEAEYIEPGQEVEDPVTGETVVATERYLLSKHPITVGGNVRVPGKARGPVEAKLVYRTAVSGTQFPALVRVPSSGYTGSAFERYGIENLRRIEVASNFAVSEARAQTVLDALKDVRHTGTIKVYGQMPSWSWGGGAAVVVDGLSERGTPVLADYQNQPLTQTGWAVDFHRQIFDVLVTDDRSQFVDLERLT